MLWILNERWPVSVGSIYIFRSIEEIILLEEGWFYRCCSIDGLIYISSRSCVLIPERGLGFPISSIKRYGLLVLFRLGPGNYWEVDISSIWILMVKYLALSI